MEKEPIGQKKIKEYVLRIRAGEPKDQIIKGLPPSFIEGIEKELSQSENIDRSKIELLKSRIEQYQVKLPNIESIVANEGGDLKVVVNGESVVFDKFIVLIDPQGSAQRQAVIMFVEKTDKTKNPGIGVPIYIELGKRLANMGITLTSSNAQYSQGQSIWMNLAKLGYARKIGTYFEFINKVLD